MTAELRVGLSESLHEVQLEDDASFLKEGARLEPGPDGMKSSSNSAPAARAHRGAQWTSQRLPRGDLGYTGRNVNPKVPRLESSYFPPLLEPRRRSERALGGGAGGLRPRCLYLQSRRSGEGTWVEGIGKSRVSELCEG